MKAQSPEDSRSINMVNTVREIRQVRTRACGFLFRGTAPGHTAVRFCENNRKLFSKYLPKGCVFGSQVSQSQQSALVGSRGPLRCSNWTIEDLGSHSPESVSLFCSNRVKSVRFSISCISKSFQSYQKIFCIRVAIHISSLQPQCRVHTSNLADRVIIPTQLRDYARI